MRNRRRKARVPKRARRRFIRIKRVTYPYTSLMFRRRRRFRTRRSYGLRLYKAVTRNWNRPVVVKFFTSREIQISGAEYFDSFNINLNSFNNDNVRQQLYGYLELFDQFKIVLVTLNMHFRTSAEYNGYAVAIKNANKRVLVLHSTIYVLFRGRKNNQSYVQPT